MNRKHLKLSLLNLGEEKLKSKLIEQKIRERFSESDVEAILNNYLDDMTNLVYLKEFQDFQAYRKEVKAEVKQLLEDLKK